MAIAGTMEALVSELVAARKIRAEKLAALRQDVSERLATYASLQREIAQDLRQSGLEQRNSRVQAELSRKEKCRADQARTRTQVGDLRAETRDMLNTFHQDRLLRAEALRQRLKTSRQELIRREGERVANYRIFSLHLREKLHKTLDQTHILLREYRADLDKAAIAWRKAALGGGT